MSSRIERTERTGRPEPAERNAGAAREATARSHCATSWQPAAVAMPCTRAITGTGRRRRLSITCEHWAKSFS